MKTLTLITLVLITLNLSAQSDSVTVSNYTHEMTDKVYTIASQSFIASNDGERGVVLKSYIKNNNLIGFTLSMYSMGSKCNENNTLIFKFSDGSKITIKSWNDFNCENSYFDTTPELLEKLKTLEIEKVYFMNGYSGESDTFNVDNKRYFIQIIKGTDLL